MKPTPAASITRTYRLPRRTLDLLDDAAIRLKMPPSHVVDALLTWALVAEAEGRLVVARRPVLYALEGIYYDAAE